MAGLAERIAEPFETFVQTVSGGGASGLDVLWELSEDVLNGSSMCDLPRRAASSCAGQACR